MKFLISILFFWSSTVSYAQAHFSHRYESTNYIAFGLGTAGYYGDLQNQLIIPFPSASVELAHKLGSQVRLRESLSVFQLGAKDANQRLKELKNRNLSFKSSNLEFSVNLQFMFQPIYSYKLRPILNPFISVGLGLVTVNPMASFEGKKYNLRKLRTEGVTYPGIAKVYPLTAGLEIAVAPYVTVISEFGYRFTNTDYLDDVSTVYSTISPSQPMRYKLADRTTELGLSAKEPGMIRGNPDVKDGYAILSFKIQYNLAQIF